MNADEKAKVLAMTDDEAYRYGWQCDHAVKKPVVFIDTLNRKHIRNQCQRCGGYGESIPKNLLSLTHVIMSSMFQFT